VNETPDPVPDQALGEATAECLALLAALTPEQTTTLGLFVGRVATGDLVASTLLEVVREAMNFPVIPVVLGLTPDRLPDDLRKFGRATREGKHPPAATATGGCPYV